MTAFDETRVILLVGWAPIALVVVLVMMFRAHRRAVRELTETERLCDQIERDLAAGGPVDEHGTPLQTSTHGCRGDWRD